MQKIVTQITRHNKKKKGRRNSEWSNSHTKKRILLSYQYSNVIIMMSLSFGS